VGMMNTAIDLLCYFILTRYCGFSGEYIYLAKALSFFIATINSFLLNKRWTFKSAAKLEWKHVFKYYTVIGSGVFISVGIHFTVMHLFTVNDLFSGATGIIFTAVWGFLLSKKLIFI
jgi:putative flippase GtrA